MDHREIIKSARLAHNFLIGVALTSACFLVSFQTAEPYRAALAEIDALHGFKGATSRFRDSFETDFDERRAADVGQINKTLLGAGYDVKAGEARASQTIPFYIYVPPFDKTVGDLKRWLQDGPHWNVSEVSFNEGEIDTLVKQAPPPSVVGTVTEWRIVADYPFDDDAQEPQQGTHLSLNGSAGYSADDEDFGLGWSSYPFGTTTNLFKWAETNGEFAGLRNPEGEWMPACRAVWEEVEHRTIESARRVLTEHVDEKDQDLMVFGATLPGETVGVLVPGVMAATLAFMLAHLQNLPQTTASRNDVVAWIPFYHDPLSRLLTFVSLAVLPTAVSLWIAFRSGSIPLWVQVTLSVLVAALSLMALRCVSKYRAFLRSAG